ncbi:hypothetical protein HNP21_002426 [Bacillus aryabhattai]|uniref:Uncharacterized protein n=1 Tax=Priestia aryabhattai TaxID=412384 RepID=A0A7W3REU9_PRIAR|nr:hypothetical protein ASG61_02780 [Bacillus sp. Leaf75]MBA9039319.1 hypothetical protein [Priestia aryabhattai]MCJ7987267.1 hypothetical protein [Priestia sp. OVL9]MUL31540.1 hypothetical protein [Priestia megaterium]MBG9934132.1 hypothetical protein [Priestia aryabhattai]
MNGSDFFIDMVSVGFMYIVAFICGLEGKTKTPAGQAEGMRPRRNASDEKAHRPPAEGEVWHGNQQRFKKQCILAPLSN